MSTAKEDFLKAKENHEYFSNIVKATEDIVDSIPGGLVGLVVFGVGFAFFGCSISIFTKLILQ
jgi:hypothetical protein